MSTSQSPPRGGPRVLNTYEVAAISIGFMGPVMAMSLNGIGVAGLVGAAVPFTFAVAFVGSLFVAYAFVRLLQRITHAGSVYALAGVTLGPKAGFFGGFALLGTYIFMTSCILGACAVFFEAMLGELGVDSSRMQMWLIVPVVVVAVGLFVNLRESQIAARTTLAIGMVGIAVMVLLALVILFRVGMGNAPVNTGIDFSVLTPRGNSWSAIMTASVFAFLSWAGFESGSSLGEETRDAKKSIPAALLAAVGIGGLVYVFVMFAQTIGFGTDAAGVADFASSSSTLTTLSSRYIGPWFAVLISVIAFAVAFGSFLSSSVATSRLLFALARDGFGPKFLTEVPEDKNVPVKAVWVSHLQALILALAVGLIGFGSIEIYYWYATLATLCMVVAYGMASVGAANFILRGHGGLAKWELIFPVLALGYLSFVFFVQIVGQGPPYTYFPWIAALWCVAGLVIIRLRPSLAKRIGERLTREEIV
ncbi:APC family permease [Corynebacterium lizhenjunii]|uniref:APC family permease n=1 Tax=Corynebacterium lizhenjunii TaxID=2709394 RepID=A0A7T0PBR2_9CORY|nr:APC family permease [Corynebacterium lizhenjunii]QPK78782.1 APC family permease [Corynebacterium lizhenjunii]